MISRLNIANLVCLQMDALIKTLKTINRVIDTDQREKGGERQMKNAMKFQKAKNSTLTEQEQNEIKELIHKLAENHKNDKWWKFECSVRWWVNVALTFLFADEEFAKQQEKWEKECNE